MRFVLVLRVSDCVRISFFLCCYILYIIGADKNAAHEITEVSAYVSH